MHTSRPALASSTPFTAPPAPEPMTRTCTRRASDIRLHGERMAGERDGRQRVRHRRALVVREQGDRSHGPKELPEQPDAAERPGFDGRASAIAVERAEAPEAAQGHVEA